MASGSLERALDARGGRLREIGEPPEHSLGLRLVLDDDDAAGASLPISPELVLVCPELRAIALAGLLAEDRLEVPAEIRLVPAADEEISEPPLLVQILGYAAWQTVSGAMWGLGMAAVVSVLVVAIGFIAR
jgi:hypothetical protein